MEKNGFLSVFCADILRGWNRAEVRGLWDAVRVFMSQKYQSFFDDASKTHLPPPESKLSFYIYYFLYILPPLTPFLKSIVNNRENIIPNIYDPFSYIYDPIREWAWNNMSHSPSTPRHEEKREELVKVKNLPIRDKSK